MTQYVTRILRVFLVFPFYLPVYAQQPERHLGIDSVALAARMSQYTTARQFRDIGALADLLDPVQVDSALQPVLLLHREFRTRHPAGVSRFRDVLDFMLERATNRVLDDIDRGLADALWLLQAGEPPRRAAIAVFARSLLPPRPALVDSSRFQLARGDSSSAVFYLTEFQVRELTADRSTARYIVYWRRGSGDWYVTGIQ